MNDPLLPYYDRELQYFSQMGAEFAARYPRVAARLRLDATGSQDPHVERLIQAFAFMNARIRFKLDDDFPELAEALLNVLYPHYLAPIPAMSIVQLVHAGKEAQLSEPFEVPAGTLLETEPVDGEPCTFRTVYPVILWPFQLQKAQFAHRPFPAPVINQPSESVLSLELSTIQRGITFAKLRPRALRFHICIPQFQYSAALYELLLSGTLDVALARTPGDSSPVILGNKALQAVGFADDEGMLPMTPRSFRGYRLLTEYFAFPRKFLFFDIVIPREELWSTFQEKAGIYIYLRQENDDLRRLTSAETLRAGCTPIVNLFSQRCDPIALSQRQTEYRVVPDARRESALELHSIDRVTLTSPDGRAVEAFPFYSARHAVDLAMPPPFWHPSRRTTRSRGLGELSEEGTDVFLSLIDLDYSPLFPADKTIHIEGTCLNRDLPGRLAARGNRLRYHLAAGPGPVSDIIGLVPPTPTRRPDLRHANLWRLVSHLSLNHLSLDVRSANIDALREILRLYDFVASADTQHVVEGIVGVQCRRSVARVGGRGGGLCRGLDVRLDIDESKFAGSGAYLFASVLSHFFGLYVSINSFTRLRASVKRQNERKEAVWSWIPRAGESNLL